MAPASGHLYIRRVGLVALWTVYSWTLLAQQPKVLAPHRAVAPRVEKRVQTPIPASPRSMVGGLWMTDANYKASIYLRNVVETDSVTVTPVLYLGNGNKYVLSDVTLDPAGVAVVSINDELQKQGISQAATLSGYVELDYNWAWDPICATGRDLDTVHSLIFAYGLQTPANPVDGAINGALGRVAQV